MPEPYSSSPPSCLGRTILTASLAAALVLGGFVVHRVDSSPRTHDAFLFADSAGLATEVNGRVARLAVRDNSMVKAGDVLAEIEHEPFELRLRQTQAAVAALHAQIGLTTRQIASQSAAAQAAAFQVARARSQVDLARSTLGRIEPLLDRGYVTRQQVDEARSQEKSATAALTAAERQAVQAREAVTDTETLRAQLRSAEAAEALAARDLKNTVLRAPFDGRISGLEIAEGAWAAAGHPLFTLIDTRRWYAVGDFRETELADIHPGDPATVWLMADGRHGLAGQVESLGGGVRPENGGAPGLPTVTRSLGWVVVAQRFPVRILLDAPPQDAMRIGATVSVRVFPGDGRPR